MKDIEEVVEITYNRARKQVAHSVYPQHDDLAQNCLKNWVARGYKHPKTTTTYTLLNNYNRITMPEYQKNYNEIKLEDWVSEHNLSETKDLHKKMYLKEFFDWLPDDGRAQDLFYRNTILGENMTSIANSYSITRQALHVYKTKIIERYKTEKGLRK